MTLQCSPSERPRCPGCTRLMGLCRSRQRHGGLPDLKVFECSRCGYTFAEWATGAAPVAERASALNLEAYTIRH